MTQNQEQPLVCNLTAIPTEVRTQHLAVAAEIFGAAREIQELPDGFALKFINEPGRLKLLTTFIEYEQLCCPFEGFDVEIEPYSGPIWLRLTGGAGVKEFLAAALQALEA